MLPEKRFSPVPILVRVTGSARTACIQVPYVGAIVQNRIESLPAFERLRVRSNWLIVQNFKLEYALL